MTWASVGTRGLPHLFGPMSSAVKNGQVGLGTGISLIRLSWRCSPTRQNQNIELKADAQLYLSDPYI